MSDNEMSIFDLARDVIKNDRAISSFRAGLLAQFVLERETKAAVPCGWEFTVEQDEMGTYIQSTFGNNMSLEDAEGVVNALLDALVKAKKLLPVKVGEVSHENIVDEESFEDEHPDASDEE